MQHPIWPSATQSSQESHPWDIGKLKGHGLDPIYAQRKPHFIHPLKFKTKCDPHASLAQGPKQELLEATLCSEGKKSLKELSIKPKALFRKPSWVATESKPGLFRLEVHVSKQTRALNAAGAQFRSVVPSSPLPSSSCSNQSPCCVCMGASYLTSDHIARSSLPKSEECQAGSPWGAWLREAVRFLSPANSWDGLLAPVRRQLDGDTLLAAAEAAGSITA